VTVRGSPIAQGGVAAVARRSRLARFSIATGIVVALVGVGLSATGVVRYEDAMPPSAQSAHAVGIVTSAATKKSRCTNAATFAVGGQQHVASTRISMDYCHYAVDDRVTVDYDPSAPNTATIVLPTSVTLGEAEVGAIVALIGAALFGAVLVGSRKRGLPSRH
jgi:hypothetical protein